MQREFTSSKYDWLNKTHVSKDMFVRYIHDVCMYIAGTMHASAG